MADAEFTLAVATPILGGALLLRPRSRSLALWSGWGLATLLLISVCSGVAFARRILTLTPSTRSIATEVSIGPEWTSIEPWLPLRPERGGQAILVGLPAGEPWPSATGDLEVELIDEEGRTYSLGWPDIHSGATPGFALWAPNLGGHRISRVRLRSRTPFRASRITWYCWDPK